MTKRKDGRGNEGVRGRMKDKGKPKRARKGYSQLCQLSGRR